MAELLARGVALHRQGELGQARVVYQQVLDRQPDHHDALHFMGVIALQSKQPDLAAALIGKAIEINPEQAAAHASLGNALKDLRRFEEAVASYDMAIAIDPANAEVHFNRGNALKKLKRLDEAIGSYDRAIAARPGHAKAHANRGAVLNELKRTEEAIASYDRAIAIRPDHAGAHFNRGNALKDLSRMVEAVASYDRAIALKPGNAETYCNRGNALMGLNRLEEAISDYEKALAARPEFGEACSNLGSALIQLNRVDEAIARYDQAIKIKPGHANAYWNKSLALLLQGNFKDGWELYEWRWKNENSQLKPRNFPQPLWLGQESLKEKTILLHGEQGLGDSIQFCRYATMVKASGARVLLEAPKALTGLMRKLAGVDELIEKGKPLPAFDYHCPLLSLPLAFKTDSNSIPSSTSYLSSDSDRRSEWSRKLGVTKKIRVGLAWSGRKTHKNDHNRSLALDEMLRYLPAQFEYISLQKEVRESDWATLRTSNIRHFGAQISDFTDTAALCDLMDIVISVDTSVAHLAGALGKPTWVLLPHVPDWRWMLEREDSPWYPSMDLFRQDGTRHWAPVLERVAIKLRQKFAGQPTPARPPNPAVKVIHVDGHRERRDAFVSRNEHLCFDFIEGVDGKSLPAEVLSDELLFENPPPVWSRGAYGCALSHLKMWNWAIEKNCPVTIAEDDAIFRFDFVTESEKVISKLPADWDLILWGWNFDSILSVNVLPGVSPTVMLFDQASLRKNTEIFQGQDTSSNPVRLDKCFGIPAYSISPTGAEKFKSLCFPIARFQIHFPVLNRKISNTGIDIAMNRIYSKTNSFVSFPPLVITKNEHAISTIQNAA